MGFDKCRDTPQARSRSKSCASALAVIVTIGMAESWGVMQRADVPRHLVAVHHRHLQVHEDEVEMISLSIPPKRCWSAVPTGPLKVLL